MAASSRAQVLDLYRAMLRESKHFSAYNYRTYAIRRIRDAFRENKNVKDPVEIQTLVNKAKRDLGMIRRQPVLRRGSHRGWPDLDRSTLAKCIQLTSLSLRIKRSPRPKDHHHQPQSATVDHLPHPFCAWDGGS
ncbi:LYR motif-containing protein 4 isoform X1 [Desmodus rotundus]|uniref:LYR motif-containing protein 4 isoform X1 n=1 Tax=Desmodus rotundus TaxID=9430 RepID=UPI0023811C42|nr:LYR motif-containing protein 4 isoform X1 [Desmodus rotundus]